MLQREYRFKMLNHWYSTPQRLSKIFSSLIVQFGDADIMELLCSIHGGNVNPFESFGEWGEGELNKYYNILYQ